jgi:PEGA domain
VRVFITFISLLSCAGAARAEEGPEVAEARAAFVEGADLARDMRWGDALGRFEHSAKLRPHAGTSYNIGICERALGHYTRALQAFRQALAENRAAGGQAINAATVADIERFVEEQRRVVATLEVTLAPADAALAVDGRPLEASDEAGTLTAGTAPAGPGRTPPAAKFQLVLDPGVHLFVVSRKGFADVARRETVAPGSRGRLDLALERLPAQLDVSANQEGAVVTVDGLDVGVAPVSLSRPAGTYRVVVRKRGFVPYEVSATVQAGERSQLQAELRPEGTSILKRWWFWTAVAAVVAGAAVVTWLIARPAPEKPPLDGGGLQWTVRVP